MTDLSDPQMGELPMPFSGKHRTICAALIDLKSKCKDPEQIKIIEECMKYAIRMSVKLTYYKQKEENDAHKG